MKKLAFVYSLLIIMLLAFSSCSRKYGCYYSNLESTEFLNKYQVNENDHNTDNLDLKVTECVQSCN